MTQPTEPDEKTAVVKVLRRIADELQTASVSRSQFLQRSGVIESKVKRLFGTYNGLVEAAGLVPMRFPFAGASTHSNEDMIAEITRVLRIPNSKLTTLFFERNSQMSLSACRKRFGGWINALKATGEKLDPERDGALLARIRAATAPQARASGAAEPAADRTLSWRRTANDEDVELPASECKVHFVHGNIYGDFIHFRGLAHVPVNELGVVFLFGMICRELGYVVEIVKPGFPDCEAKRQVRPGIWQRVRIEFEFRSRIFRTHGHDPEQCDMIVCWEHNWPDCPIEVLELKSALQRLSPSAAVP
jgi:hypothetical protein